jgi:hypothetical protein
MRGKTASFNQPQSPGSQDQTAQRHASYFGIGSKHANQNARARIE